jgi:hypothetical protein
MGNNENVLKVISMLTKAKVMNVNVGEEGIVAATVVLCCIYHFIFIYQYQLS